MLPRNALRLLFQSGAGKAGLVMFGAMLALSVWVLASYPLQFGSDRWSNPGVWADNPKAAPPAWTTWLGNEAFAHRTYSATEPESETERGPATVRTYPFTLAVEEEAPDFLSITLSDVTFYARPPVVVAQLLRPDGSVIRLSNIAVRAAREGEALPVTRYADRPERVLLTEGDTLRQGIEAGYAAAYPSVAATVGSDLNRALFGRPDEDGSGALVPLAGEYRLEIQVLVADKRDTVGTVGAVAGGTVFGVMGTDAIGRNLWEGLLYGFPVALLIATVTSLISTVIGASLGIVSGYAGGATDAVIQRLCDIISNVPLLPLLIFLVFILGSHLWLIMLVLVAFSWPGLTILVRSMVLQIRSGQLVETAKSMGASRRRVMARHVFPQTAPFIVAQMIFFAPGAILAEASLSFLGLGDPSVPTWGQMLQAGFQTGALYVGYWWWVIPPGVLIVVTAVAFMLLALAMEPIVDPRLRKVAGS